MSDEPTDRRVSSWRKSLSTAGVGLVTLIKSAAVAARGGTKKQQLSAAAREELRKSESIVRFTGVQVRWLVAYWGDIRDGKIAGDVKLVVAKEQLADDVWVGRTMGADGRVPYRKSGELQAFTAEQVTEKPREDWTISDVCDFVIIPAVMELQCFFTETLASKHVGKPFQGAFVSQARSSLFADLVAALTRHYTKDGAQEIPVDAFVWLDLFCANQSLLTQQDDGATDAVMKERADLLTRGFHLAIEQFDERLFFFDSWLAPAALTRMWCIWEVYGAIKSGEKMTVIFAPGEEDKFVDAIKGGKEIAQYIANMRPDQAQCFDADDLDMITAAVEGSVGWPKLKQMIMEQLNTWMLLQTEASVKRVAAEEGSGESEAFGDLLNNAGVFMQVNGQLDVALSYYEKVLGVLASVHGTEEHTSVARVLMNMAAVYQAQGKLDKALETYQRSYDIAVAAYDTEEHPEVARTLNNMAVVYEAQGKLDKALETYQRSYDIAVAAYDTEEHTSVAKTLNNMWDSVRSPRRVYPIPQYESILSLNNMAGVYEVQGKLDKALETYQRSYDIAVAAYSTDEHPRVAGTLQNMAGVYKAQGKLDKALETYQRSYDIAVAAYSTDEHPRVATTLYNLAHVQEDMGLLNEALVNAERALVIWTTVLPAGHQHIEYARVLVARLADAIQE